MTCTEPKWKTCGECAYFAMCWAAKAVMVKQHKERGEITRYREHFLDRERQVLLPCREGEFVFMLSKQGVVVGLVSFVQVMIDLGKTELRFRAEAWSGPWSDPRAYFSGKDIGKSVFLSKPEAEAAWAAWAARAQ